MCRATAYVMQSPRYRSYSLAQTNGNLQLSIEDDGPGVPSFERARVLEPFARLDPSRSRNSGGLGLGLTIVDRILAAAGGQLKLEDSELGARVSPRRGQVLQVPAQSHGSRIQDTSMKSKCAV